ncbi:MAG: Chemotaxis protein CheV [Anaerolineae bacterium]|nr:Chemotaxis protein CheV [Anaerolineae bacterium]
MLRYVLFLLDTQAFALPLAGVEQVIRAVEITPLPQAPPTLVGVIDVHGTVLPVVNIRQQLGLPDQAVQLDDQLVIAQLNERWVAFVVTEVRGIIEPSIRSLVAAKELFPGVTHLEGGVKTEDGLIFIHSLDELFAHSAEGWLADIRQ